jgi:hypothetical protein
VRARIIRDTGYRTNVRSFGEEDTSATASGETKRRHKYRIRWRATFVVAGDLTFDPLLSFGNCQVSPRNAHVLRCGGKTKWFR